VVEGAEAVVFAAAASAGWRVGATTATPPHVDYRGLQNVAEACVRHRVPRLVVVSSALVTRPFHPIAILLNGLCGRILHWKRKGELAALEAAAREGSGLAVTVIRPGGLTNKPAQGPIWMQVGQGDQVSGAISREDVARAAIEAIRHDKTKGVVFELVASKEERPQQGDWAAVFKYLRPHDGSYDPKAYTEGSAERNEL
jgi:nucleoside-diphosphate-sugar epimerase